MQVATKRRPKCLNRIILFPQPMVYAVIETHGTVVVNNQAQDHLTKYTFKKLLDFEKYVLGTGKISVKIEPKNNMPK